MTIDIWLGAALAVTALIYWWVGRTIVSQPSWARPPMFSNHHPILLGVAVFLPIASLLAVAVAGFAFTDHGWRYLVGSLAAFFLLAVRPSRD
jgi:hypothetical protein